jgi:hypothetical protein
MMRKAVRVPKRQLYYFACNRKPWDQGRPWWQYVFHEGEFERDDKEVAWVIKSYSPGDGKVRQPLRVRRNRWNVPEVWSAGIRLVVSERVRNELLAPASTCEFLEIAFESSYEIPWGDGIDAPLADDASEAAIRQLTRNPRFQSGRSLGRYYELITLRERHYAPSPGYPFFVIKGKLHNTRTVDLDEEISVEVDVAKLDSFQLIYFGGGGLICTQRGASLLRQFSDPAWYAFDELTAEIVEIRGKGPRA